MVDGVIIIHSDGAKEYETLAEKMQVYNVERTFSLAYTPENNALAEYFNRTSAGVARVLLIQAELFNCLWPFDLKNVAFVRNRMEDSTTGKKALNLLTGMRPYLKEF